MSNSAWNIHVNSFPWLHAHTHAHELSLSFIGDKAPNTWHLIIWKREWVWNIWEIYLHASHLPDSLKSHAQSSALLSAQRITQTVCMNNGHTLNPRCAKGKKERKIKREEENWIRCGGQTTETRRGTELNYNLRDPGLILKGWWQRFRQTRAARVKYLFLDQCADDK